MSAAMATLREAGITITAAGDALVAQPRSALTDELRSLIRAHKVGLMAELRSDDEIEVIRQAFGIEPPKAAPALVRCCDCVSFIPDAIGDGWGIGARGRWGTRPALWARGERRCGDYRKR